MPGQTLTRPSAGWGLLLLPYEASTSYLKGAGGGPAALLPHLPRELLESREEVVQGTLSPEAYLEAAARAAGRILDSGRRVAAVGGEHTVTYGVLEGYVASGRRPAVIQLDAHADLREEYEGSPWSHACVMRRVAEGLALATLGVAVRALSLEEADFLRESRRGMVYAHELTEGPGPARAAAACLGQEVYLTVDIDFLDPSVAPGTGTPEPGGPSWYGGLELIDALLDGKRLVGFDLVEVAPAAGRDVTAPAAASLFRYLLERSGARS